MKEEEEEGRRGGGVGKEDEKIGESEHVKDGGKIRIWEGKGEGEKEGVVERREGGKEEEGVAREEFERGKGVVRIN